MTHLLWSDDSWKRSVTDWITARVSEAGRRIRGQITQPHIRPWSTALRVPTDGGLLWFKAGTSAFAHEARLTEFLSQLMPDHLPEVLAVEPVAGWMLSEDMGEKVRERIRSFDDFHLLGDALTVCRDLQEMAAERLPALLETGLMDRRIGSLKAEWEDLLADTDRLRVGRAGGLPASVHARARKLWPHLEELMERASVPGLPDTVVHEDLHDANLFLNGGRMIISDWGDSSVANPLTTLTVFLRSAAHRRGVGPDAAPVAALRDHFVKLWRTRASEEDIRRAAPLAIRIGSLYRSLTWRRAIMSAPPEAVEEWADSVPGWFEEFVEGFDLP